MTRAPTLAAFVAALMLPAAAWANDTSAELSTGGLVPRGNTDVEMAREVLSISTDRVTVDYVFRNRSDRDVTTVVAFPMPDITGAVDFMHAVPDYEADNFLDFTVTQDGKPITPALDARASIDGRDITAELAAQGIPLNPLGPKTTEALAALPAALQQDWTRRGLVERVEYDVGQGLQSELVPLCTVSRSFYWTTTFPAGREVAVAHSYRPSVGGTVALTFMDEKGRFSGPQFDDYRNRYCMDDAFLRGVTRRSGGTPYGKMSEAWISYVLGTGANWAGGRIGDFTLRVDKGSPDALVSFCGTGVRKTGPTTFEMHATDFRPPAVLDILILNSMPG